MASAQTDTGLRATYFQSKGMNKANEQKLERVTKSLSLTLGERSYPEIDGEQFAIIWEGAFLRRPVGTTRFE